MLRTGITFYLSNGSVGTQATLAKMVYVEFEQIGKGIHTLGRLDPLTLGDIDPFTLGEISNISADWMALRNEIVAAVSNIASQGDDLQMRLESNSVVATEKAIFTGKLSSFIHTTGLAKQRIMTLGELDSHVLEDIDMMLTTFRVFEDIPANIVKFIGVTYRNMLKSVLAENTMGANIYSNAENVGIQLNKSISEIEAGIEVNASDVNMALNSAADDIEVSKILTPYEHKTALSSSGITIEVTTITETT